jgi:chaperonin GroEL
MKANQKPGLVFQPHVYQALQRGIQQMVGAISPTLGPVASGVAIDHIHKTKTLPEFLDDGGVIARRMIELPNRDEDMGAMLVRAMVLRQHERTGDGTATVAVLFEALFKAGVRYITAGGNAMQVRRHLEKAIPMILEEIAGMTFKIGDKTTLKRMAYSLCHDAEMADLIGETFDLIGELGRLEIREDYGRILRREYVQGSHYYSGAISTSLFPEGSGQHMEFHNPAIFLCDWEVQDHHDLFPVLQTAHKNGVQSLLIIARNLSETAIALLNTNNKLNTFKTMAVKLPGLNPQTRMAAIEDLSMLTGASPFLKITGETLENFRVAHFGKARRVWVDVRTFGIVGGRGDKRQLRDHIHRLHRHYHLTRDSDERKAARERVGNLQGGSATLWVGGFSETEINAQKSRAERATQAIRAAIQAGVVPGGGIALLNCRKRLEAQLKAAEDTDERAAYRILLEALAVPAQTIFRNAGYDPSEVMAKLSFESPLAGFDVITGQVVDVCEAGILDSADVLVSSIQNAISTAALALTIDSLVHVTKPEMIGNPE